MMSQHYPAPSLSINIRFYTRSTSITSAGEWKLVSEEHVIGLPLGTLCCCLWNVSSFGSDQATANVLWKIIEQILNTSSSLLKEVYEYVCYKSNITKMEAIMNALLVPRRISQIYADTKKSYEHVVQSNNTNPQLSSLHIKLRIQKDRLVAWGLEWADSNANQSGDIDGSLDRAGISDLVASIMSTIRELLDEAERIQPSSQHQLPGGYPGDKLGALVNNQWSAVELARLGDVVKDITVSIDTLCDLSRSQQVQRQSSFQHDEQKAVSNLSGKVQAFGSRSLRSSPPDTPTTDSFPLLQDSSSIIASSRIDFRQLTFPASSGYPGSQPPSYDSVATSPGNREFALLKPKLDDFSLQTPQCSSDDVPVLVEYGYDFDSHPGQVRLSSLKRYESLVLALQSTNREFEHAYTGCLRILGWFADRSRSRFGFVYDVPRPILPGSISHGSTWRPQTLMSYLQHSGHDDSANMPSLEDRFRLAFNLASNLLHIHAKGLTHRNINSNNIVFGPEVGNQPVDCKPWVEGAIRKPFLVSWDQCNEDASVSQTEMLISKIYRHPDVKRGQRSVYRPAFDIYSLGLVLLEIGLWMPIHKLWKAKYTLLDFQRRLQSVYATKLAGKCSSNYMRAVGYCLHVADAVSAVDSSAIHQIGEGQSPKTPTDFYWNALKPLERCCMIDDSNEPVLLPCPSAPALKPDALGASVLADEQFENSHLPLLQTGADSQSLAPRQKPERHLKTESPLEPGIEIDLLIWSCRVPVSTRAYFDTVMMPKLSRMFARAINRWESYEIDIFMAGDSPETAKPTLLMVCKSIVRAWKILHYVNNDKKLFDIKVAVGQIKYSKNGKKRTRPKKVAAKSSQNHAQNGNGATRYQQKPVCGASIGAFVDEQHLEAVTFGGIVLVGGQPFGMSVHHMLEDQDTDHGLEYVLDTPEPEAMTSQKMGYEEDLTYWTDEWDEDIQHFDQGSDDDDDCINMGDTLGTQPGTGRELVVTQPALDDVDPTFFPSEDDMSDEHLSCHGLGYIHASSGLKQVKHGSVSHEVDWALFRVCDHRLSPVNNIEGGEKYRKNAPSPHPCGILRADSLGDLDVHAFGSKSGLAGGKISSDMAMTRMPGRVFASPVWRFQGDFGVGGDSGAWVIDNESGGVCGHVTAWSDFHQNGTISPMEVLLHDMEKTLGKPVALPVPDGVPVLTYKQQYANQVDDQELQASELRGKAVEATLDSNYGSDTEPGNPEAGRPFTPSSPAIATSPSPNAQEIESLSLENVAEQWTQAQTDRESLDGAARVKNDFGSAINRELRGLEARC